MFEFQYAMKALERQNEDCLEKIESLETENNEYCAENNALRLLMVEMQKHNDVAQAEIESLRAKFFESNSRIKSLERDLRESIRKNLKVQTCECMTRERSTGNE